MYETLWARHLNAVVGTSQLAICTVLAAFMGGLATGAFAAAHWGKHVDRPLLVYAVLEAFIGAYALAFPSLIQLVTPAHLALSAQLPAGSLILAMAQLVLLGALLLPPTICMGATLPLLARLVAPEGERAGFQVGRLYGANTLGAVLGTALAGFFLLPRLWGSRRRPSGRRPATVRLHSPPCGSPAPCVFRDPRATSHPGM